jgi:aspartate/methionine/tyrosine aminotransferase
MLEPDKVRTEMKALQKHFKEKRDYVVGRLREMGFNIKTVPDSTFYLWLDLEGLPDASKYSIFVCFYQPTCVEPVFFKSIPIVREV